jgi:aryl-alcohol dehydrogenase-like predicted oxidoreductase
MQYRTLGKTGLRVSVVGVGTWQFGGEWGKDFAQDEVDRMFDAARDAGINLIDTAECYGDHTSEALIGGAIERDRGKWIVATKFGHKFHGYMNRTEPRSPQDVRNQLEASLKALRTDYVDLLQYHSWGDDQFFDADVQAELEKLKASGKARHLGNSVGKNSNVRQIDASTEKDIEVIQVIYNRLDQAPQASGLLDSCIRQRLGVLARVPLASGFLSGKYKPGARFGQSDVRSGRDRQQVDEKLRAVEQIQKTEVPPGLNMAEWALAWCLQHPAVTSVIPGCKSVEQVRSNARAAELSDLVRDDHPQAAA